MTVDFVCSVCIVAVVASGLVAYLVRRWLRGRTRSERVARIGGSFLFPTELMEASYWASRPVVGFCVLLHISADMLTWMSLPFAAGSALGFATRHFGVGAFFGILSAVCDLVDGMLAREQGTASDAGEVLDAALDRYGEFFILAGLLFFYRSEPMAFVLVLLATLGSFMISYSTAKAEALGVPPPRGAMRRHERSIYLFAGATFVPFLAPWLERDDRLPRGLPALLAIFVIALVSNVSAVRRFMAIARSVRQLVGAGRAANAAAITVALMPVQPLAPIVGDGGPVNS